MQREFLLLLLIMSLPLACSSPEGSDGDQSELSHYVAGDDDLDTKIAGWADNLWLRTEGMTQQEAYEKVEDDLRFVKFFKSNGFMYAVLTTSVDAEPYHPTNKLLGKVTWSVSAKKNQSTRDLTWRRDENGRSLYNIRYAQWKSNGTKSLGIRNFMPFFGHFAIHAPKYAKGSLQADGRATTAGTGCIRLTYKNQSYYGVDYLYSLARQYMDTYFDGRMFYEQGGREGQYGLPIVLDVTPFANTNALVDHGDIPDAIKAN